ncbi:hypothetical protein R1sor_003491 [Riccia sorocarpa]|uniref:Tyrosine specific protein phosphatases domain-containing protein n=1 Tax=Riccia sorocarpa TaxID=122646 RepID=A0ABD3H4L3_9MARC
MGISVIVTIPSTVLLGSFVGLRNNASPFVLFPLLQASLVGFSAAVASSPYVNKPYLFGKTSQGDFPWWSYALFHPYLFGLRAYVLMRRIKNKEDVYNQVSPGLFVGGWPSGVSDLPPGNPAVVDCTCELPRPDHADPREYLNVPTWDTRGPFPEDIEKAVQWAVKKREQERPIYVHCAFGHGRSVTVMCALMVALGLTDTWSKAEKLIQVHRPRARLNKAQQESLQQWSKFRTTRPLIS